ncbi:DNA repair helicase RAD3 [Spironucleus salmonicida]|uniref:DNA repair helicase RAD3 n=1 Tax=Spironucleus salmonicida TaxID=348837 RepID=V6LXC9_9EUKA|nr:DNA repair helicase RAD3 [Spironucleus salmonicida]|eukprot:EST49200.1 DNA repair helicase RAD3 [Spironucleus salmonicida]
MQTNQNSQIPFFPFTPQQPQLDFYKFIYGSLSKPAVILTELNTGGGKTLLSACAALNQPKRRIIYATRTFQEVLNVVNQLKKLKTTFSLSFLASKQKTCINPDVRFSSDIDHTCSQIYRNCQFYQNSLNYHSQNINDMEDFEVAQICPFFANRAASKTAKFVVCSYNYIFDSEISALNEFDESSILIVDEAHNIPKVATSSISAQFTKNECEKCAQDIAILIKALKSITTIKSLPLQFILQLQIILNEIKILKNIESARVYDVQFETSRIISQQKYDKNMLLEGIRYLKIVVQVLKQANISIVISKQIINLTKFASILMYVDLYPNQAYKFALTVDYPFMKFEDSTKIILANQRNIVELTCLDCAIGIEKIIKGFTNIIFMSGTLRPFHISKQIMGLDRLQFKYQLNIIQFSTYLDKNFKLFLLTSGLNREEITLNFTHRFEQNTVVSVANVLIQLSKTVSDGILLFFPSFAFLEQFAAFTQMLNLKIQGNRLIFFESNNTLESQHALNCHMVACDMGRGSIFCAVARGSFAEGIDIGSQYGRLVVIIGVPYMFRQSARIQAQMKFYQSLDISEDEYMEFDALQITQQAVGRICRKSSEYGCILFVESRFKPVVRMLDHWAKSKGFKETHARQIIQGIKDFLLEQQMHKIKE